jgi:hypothetical protein
LAERLYDAVVRLDGALFYSLACWDGVDPKRAEQEVGWFESPGDSVPKGVKVVKLPPAERAAYAREFTGNGATPSLPLLGRIDIAVVGKVDGKEKELVRHFGYGQKGGKYYIVQTRGKPR